MEEEAWVGGRGRRRGRSSSSGKDTQSRGKAQHAPLFRRVTLLFSLLLLFNLLLYNYYIPSRTSRVTGQLGRSGRGGDILVSFRPFICSGSFKIRDPKRGGGRGGGQHAQVNFWRFICSWAALVASRSRRPDEAQWGGGGGGSEGGFPPADGSPALAFHLLLCQHLGLGVHLHGGARVGPRHPPAGVRPPHLQVAAPVLRTPLEHGVPPPIKDNQGRQYNMGTFIPLALLPSFQLILAVSKMNTYRRAIIVIRSHTCYPARM